MIRYGASFLWLLGVWVVLRAPPGWIGVLAGALLCVALLALFRPLPRGLAAANFHPLQVVSFFTWFGWKLVEANLQVAVAVVWPHRIRETRAVIAMPLVPISETAAMILANAISLTPGTFIVDYRGRPSTMYVHVLDCSDRRRCRLELMEVQRRVVRAFGTREALARLEDLVRQIEEGERA